MVDKFAACLHHQVAVVGKGGRALCTRIFDVLAATLQEECLGAHVLKDVPAVVASKLLMISSHGMIMLNTFPLAAVRCVWWNIRSRIR